MLSAFEKLTVTSCRELGKGRQELEHSKADRAVCEEDGRHSVAGAREGWILTGSSASWKVPEQANIGEPSSGFHSITLSFGCFSLRSFSWCTFMTDVT